MKKYLIITLLFVLSLNIFIGCGSNKENEITEKEIEQQFEELDESKENNNEKKEENPTKINFSKYKATEEIKNAKYEDGKIQIGDVILENGTQMSDLIKAIDDSKIDWEYEYNPNELVLSGERISSKFFINDTPIFTINALNCSTDDKTAKADECIVTSIWLEETVTDGVYYAYGHERNGSNVSDYYSFIEKLSSLGYEYEEKKTDNGISVRILELKHKEYSELNLKFNLRVGTEYLFDQNSGKCKYIGSLLYSPDIFYSKIN